MYTRKAKILRTMRFVITAVLCTIIIVSAVIVPSFAVSSITTTGYAFSPTAFISFNFDVYQRQTIGGKTITTRSVNVPITENYGFNTIDREMSYDYFGYITEVQVPSAETYNIGLEAVLEEHSSTVLQTDYGYDYTSTLDFFIDSIYGIRQSSGRVDLSSLCFYSSSYYIWGNEFGDFDQYYEETTPLNMRIGIDRNAYEGLSLLVNYSLQGDPELRQFSLYNDDVPHDDNFVYFGITTDMIGEADNSLVYIHSAMLTISDDDVIDEPFGNEYKLENYLEGNYLTVDISGSRINAIDLHGLDVQSHTVEYEFQNYTAWLASAVGGFLGTEIFGGITFGGLLAMVVGFFGVLWFLKVFAGG